MANAANEKLIMDFFEAMGPDLAGVLKAYETYMHPEAVWKNSGFPDLIGIDAMKHLLVEQQRLFGFERVRVLEHRYLGSADDRVFFERRDSICRADGSVVFAFDILGMFVISGRKIMAWHDYMDTSVIKEQWEKLAPIPGS